jgi:ABC-2 type transport system permease protein
MNTMLLLVRREFWEHRAFVFAPAIVGVIWVLVAMGFGIFGPFEADELRTVMQSHPDLEQKAPGALAALLIFLTSPFAIVMCVVAFFYLLDSLYADRRDRSVLFWKSLPVSDRSTVLSKLATVAIALPVLTLVAALATNVLVAFIACVRLSIEGIHIWHLLWNPAVWLAAYAIFLYAVAAAVLWYLPIFGYLLLVSASAGRAVMLWAVLPPIGLVILEYVIFRTDYVADLIGDRFNGWMPLALNVANHGEHAVVIDGERIPFSAHIADVIDPVTFLGSPGLWLGLLVAAVFTYAAIMVRRNRSEV